MDTSLSIFVIAAFWSYHPTEDWEDFRGIDGLMLSQPHYFLMAEIHLWVPWKCTKDILDNSLWFLTFSLRRWCSFQVDDLYMDRSFAGFGRMIGVPGVA